MTNQHRRMLDRRKRREQDSLEPNDDRILEALSVGLGFFVTLIGAAISFRHQHTTLWIGKLLALLGAAIAIFFAVRARLKANRRKQKKP